MDNLSLLKWPSNDPFLPKLSQKDGSVRNIREMFMSTGLTVRPSYKSRHQEFLTERLKSTFYNNRDTVGLLYMANSLAELLNTENTSDVIRPSDLLFEALYVSSSQTVTLLYVVKNKNDEVDEKQKYILQLTRKVTKRIRQFTDEHISCIYGLLDSDELKDDHTFHKCLLSMEEKARLYNNLISLQMTQDKCEKVFNAFIVAVGTRQLVPGEKEDDELSPLTEEQFYERIKAIEGKHEHNKETFMEQVHLRQPKSRTSTTLDIDTGDDIKPSRPHLEEDGSQYCNDFEIVNALQEETSRHLQRLLELNAKTKNCMSLLKAHISQETAPVCIVKKKTTDSATQTDEKKKGRGKRTSFVKVSRRPKRDHSQRSRPPRVLQPRSEGCLLIHVY